MNGRINGISSHYLGGNYDDLSELIDNAYYDTLPPDALDFTDENDIPEINNSFNGSEVKQIQEDVEISQSKSIIEEFIYYFNLGVDCRQRGDNSGAIMAWNKATSLNPNNAHTYYYRGVAKAEIGDYDDAVQDLKQALIITPNYLNANRQLEKIRQDVLENSKVLKLKHNNYTLHYQHGKIRAQFQEYQQAINEFTQALQINANFATAYYHRGKIYYKLKNKEAAIQDLQTAAKLFCENDQAEQLAKWTLFELGESNRKEAIPYIIPYLSRTSSYDEKRLSASAIYKLGKKFKNISDLVIYPLLDNLTYPAPQVRQYVLKALSVIYLPNSATLQIQEIANKDTKEYNRNLAKSILDKLKSTSSKDFTQNNKFKLDNNSSLRSQYFDHEESNNSWEQEDVYQKGYDTSMDYGYLADLSNPEDYLYNY